MNRPETGPMQFGEDWPGIFIRGDNAAHYAYCLDNPEQPMSKAFLKEFAKLLRSSNVNEFPIVQKAKLEEQ